MTSPFIEHLAEIHARDDRAARAALRQAFRRPGFADPAVFPHVFPYLPKGRGRWFEDAHIIVAALFGMLPSAPTTGMSVGAALGRVARSRDSESIESRFVALLRASEEDLGVHLRNAVALIAANDTPISLNYADLIRHLTNWGHPSGWVQRAWARDFWDVQDTSQTVPNAEHGGT